MPFCCTRNLHVAIQLVSSAVFTVSGGSRPNVPHWAIVIVTGQSSDARLTSLQARDARNLGIRLFVVGIGAGTTLTEELRGIASYPNDVYQFNLAELRSGFAEQFICSVLAVNGQPVYTSCAYFETTVLFRATQA